MDPKVIETSTQTLQVFIANLGTCEPLYYEKKVYPKNGIEPVGSIDKVFPQLMKTSIKKFLILFIILNI